MSEKTQPNIYSLIASMKVLLIVAVAVCLLSTLASWMIESPVQTAIARAEEAEPPSPTPVTVTDSFSPPATPELTAVPTTVVPSSTPVSTSTTPSHVVQEGETLGAIARAYGVSIEVLVAANNLTDPDLLYVGQTLVLPEDSAIITQEPDPTAVPAQPTSYPAVVEERWIDVDLEEQLLTAYEGNTPVHTTLVSTGLPNTPTPEGQFRIWIKFRYDDMAGADYYIEDVPYVMYFHEGYGLHGVTWHGNFGRPMSHGCVNLPTSEAEWLFDWANVGMLVNIHI
jgi:lipoprotein-anchoring transpeptidase ErfK/SrfK